MRTLPPRCSQFRKWPACSSSSAAGNTTSARSVTSLEILPRPGDDRPGNQPWPTYPMLFRVSTSHEEGEVDREFAVSTTEFVGRDGQVTALRLTEVEFVDGKLTPVPGTEREIPADLVLLAMGFSLLADGLGDKLGARV